MPLNLPVMSYTESAENVGGSAEVNLLFLLTTRSRRLLTLENAFS